jgi:hypothetical protein
MAITMLFTSEIRQVIGSKRVPSPINDGSEG